MTTDELLAECRATLPKLTWEPVGTGATACGHRDDTRVFVAEISGRVVAWTPTYRRTRATVGTALAALLDAHVERRDAVADELCALRSMCRALEGK